MARNANHGEKYGYCNDKHIDFKKISRLFKSLTETERTLSK